MSLLDVSMRQDGNSIFVSGTDSLSISYDVEGVDMPQVSDMSFALWHVLPHVMKTGTDVHIEGRLDPQTLKNAETLSQIWEMWQPHRFRSIRVSADEIVPPAPAQSDTALTFFSGGVDSTHMLVAAGKQPQSMPVLNVHGMEYNVDATTEFENLVAQTDPLLKKYNYHRVTLKTDASKYASGHHAWGMALAGHAHLFSGLFSGGVFAADHARYQDFMNHPWGCNHVTNSMMSGNDFLIRDACEDWTRGEKLPLLLEDEVAMKSITFCKDKSIRPANCGLCSKCVRTKLLFAATCGRVPQIFLKNRFDAGMISRIDLNDKIEAFSFSDAYRLAKTNGYLNRFPEIARRFDEECRIAKTEKEMLTPAKLAHVKHLVKSALGPKLVRKAKRLVQKI